MFAVHGDDKGLIIPPRVAPIQVVIVPIYQEENKEVVLNGSRKLYEKLKEKFSVHLDDRDEYTPGFKFNEWELKGVPLRIEIGPRDIERDQVVLVRRDSGDKSSVPISKISNEIENTLDSIQKSLLERAKKHFEEHIEKVEKYEDLERIVNGKWALGGWCGDPACEKKIKDETSAKIITIPFDLNENPPDGHCVVCGKPAKYNVYIAKSY